MMLELLACGALMIANLGLGIAALKGRLPRNYFAGIRTTKLLRDNRSWVAGHRAAAPTFIGLGILGLVAMVSILVTPNALTDAILYGYLAIVLVGLAYGAWVAGRAVDRLTPLA